MGVLAGVAALVVTSLMLEATSRGAGQTATSPPPAADPQQQPTFRVEANYIRVDAYVTKDGEPVTDLTRDDFEILEDGVPQALEQFELIQIRGFTSSDQRLNPTTVAAARSLAENPRRRVLIVFLDGGHVTIAGSHAMRKSLVDFLRRTVGPDDLVGVMTPDMSAAGITMTGRTELIEADLERNWTWGERDQTVRRDPEEQSYETCYPERSATEQCQGFGNTTATVPANFYNGIAREMVERRREKRTLDALEDLSTWLRGIREERKAVVTISSGWRLYRPNQALTRVSACDRPASGTNIGAGPDGRITLNAPRSRSEAPDTSWESCEQARQRLSMLDNHQQFLDFFDEANRANVSFYTLDPRGLAAFDSGIEETKAGADNVTQPRFTLAEDRAMLGARLDSLRMLADNTDGLAIVNTNRLDAGFKRISDDLSWYHLLGYYSTNTALDGRYRKLTVRVKRPGIQVRARRGYRAASAADVSTRALAPGAGAGCARDPSGHGHRQPATRELVGPTPNAGRLAGPDGRRCGRTAVDYLRGRSRVREDARVGGRRLRAAHCRRRGRHHPL